LGADSRLSDMGGIVSVDVIGREEELDRINGFLDSVDEGSAALVLEGEAGIGKTTLWLAGVEAASSRASCVLAARPAEAEQDLAHAGLGDLLEGVLDDVLPALPPPRRRALEVALLLAEADQPAPDASALAVALQTVLEALTQAGPVVIAIDDIQWLHRSSARALEFALRRLRQDPVLVLLAYRAGPQPEPVPIERVLPPELLQRVPVTPLSLGAIQRLVRARLGRTFARPTLRRLYDASAGNPFFALELARSLRAGEDPAEPLRVPKTLEDLVHDRLEALPDATRRALLTVAALGKPTVTLARAAGAGDEALEPDYSARVIERVRDEIRFEHPLLASAVYGGARDEERRRVHRRLADVVEEPVSRARHLALGSSAPDTHVADELEDAIVLARARGAIAAAADLGELAVRATPPEARDDAHRRMLLAGRDYFAAGDPIRARALTHELLENVGPGPRRAEALALLGELDLQSGRVWAGIQRLEQALREADDLPALQVQIHQRLAWVVRFNRSLAEAEPHVRTALELAERLGDAVLRSRGLAALAVFRRSILGDARASLPSRQSPWRRRAAIGGHWTTPRSRSRTCCSGPAGSSRLAAFSRSSTRAYASAMRWSSERRVGISACSSSGLVGGISPPRMDNGAGRSGRSTRSVTTTKAGRSFRPPCLRLIATTPPSLAGWPDVGSPLRSRRAARCSS
jgi:AAA ATPase domain